MFRRILVATDLTKQSSQALRLAQQLASPGCKIFAIHVLDMPPVLDRWSNAKLKADAANYRDLLERQMEAATERLDAQLLSLELDRKRIELMVRVGDPATHIAQAATRLLADLIVVGRGGGGRLGPIAEAVVRLVGRTVMVAPVPTARRAVRGLPSSSSRRRMRASA